MKLQRLLPALLCLLLLCACGSGTHDRTFYCRVVLEEGEGFTCGSYAATVIPGQDAVFDLRCADGYAVTGADCGDYTLAPSDGGGMTLTVRGVRYSTAISLTVERSAASIRYDINDGSGTAPVERPVTPSHLRWNTAAGIFTRPGHTLTGWNTRPDGFGTPVGLGSRVEPEDGLTLYAQWSPWSAAELFRWQEGQGGVAITAYLGIEETVVVPAQLDGRPVRSIAKDAFRNVKCETVVLPDTLYELEEGAFYGCTLSTLYLFDNIRAVGDPVFEGCKNLSTLHLNAVESPVYSGTYFDTFQDKFDRLVRLRDQKKIVLFAGSSVRFGFDCAALDAAFPGYETVNMGVFAYTSAMPQMELILSCMGEGDILLHCPEYDAADLQFCTTADIEYRFFNMMESNYDTLSLLDLRRYGAVFTPLEKYLTVKDPMAKKSYALSASGFDEDGGPVSTPSYNEYGDYVVYRPNAPSALPVYGAPVHYTVTAFPKETYIDPLNRMYRRFLDKGVTVYYTYSPRNSLALSEASTPEARAELDAYLRENLCVPIITELEDSLWSGVYLYGTDNHLSTEGAAIHTGRIIAALKSQMEQEQAAKNGKGGGTTAASP